MVNDYSERSRIEREKLNVILLAVVLAIFIIVAGITTCFVGVRTVAFENGYQKSTIPGYDVPVWRKVEPCPPPTNG